MKTIIQFPSQTPAPFPTKIKATVGFATHIDKIGYTGILTVDNSTIEVSYVQADLAPGYIPKEGDKVVFEASQRNDLEFPYMYVRNIRRRVGV